MRRRFWAWAVRPLSILLAVADRLVCESVQRALPPEPSACPDDHGYTPLADILDGPEPLPHVHDWTTARAFDWDQRDACRLCGERRDKTFDEHADEALAMVAGHPAADDSLDIADMALSERDRAFADAVLAGIDNLATTEGAE